MRESAVMISSTGSSAKPLLVGVSPVARHVLERQDGNRGFIGERQTLRGRWCRFRGASQTGQPIAAARNRHNVAVAVAVLTERLA